MEKKIYNKQALRKHSIEARMTLSQKSRDEKNLQIFYQVIHHPAFLRANDIFCYVDAKGEVDTHRLIDYSLKSKKRIAVPRVEGKQIEFYFIEGFHDLEKGCFDISEPKKHCEKAIISSDSLIIMPGVVFDIKRNRIGYGAGFYDRFLSSNPKTYSIALAFDLQIVKQIHAEEHDRRPDIIFTEKDKW